MVILIFVMQTLFHCTFLHQRMYVANVLYHSLLAAKFHFWFPTFALVLQAANTGARSHRYEAIVEPHRIELATHVRQLFQTRCTSTLTTSMSRSTDK